MAIITFDQALGVGSFYFGRQRRDIGFQSVFASQSFGVSGPLWFASIGQPNTKESESGGWQVLALDLEGQVNQLALWNLMRPAPLGTLRGTLTLSGAHAQGAVALAITGGAGQAGATLKKGDYLGFGTGTSQHLVIIKADATADGAGLINVSINSPLRTAFSSGSSVTWDKPKALFRQTVSRNQWKYDRGNIVSGITLDLREDWRA